MFGIKNLQQQINRLEDQSYLMRAEMDRRSTIPNLDKVAIAGIVNEYLDQRIEVIEEMFNIKETSECCGNCNSTEPVYMGSVGYEDPVFVDFSKLDVVAISRDVQHNYELTIIYHKVSSENTTRNGDFKVSDKIESIRISTTRAQHCALVKKYKKQLKKGTV